MKTPHLVSALVASLVLAIALVAGTRYAEDLESRYVPALTDQIFPQKSLGVAFMRAALQKPNTLIMMGSSELRSGGTFGAGQFYATYPTGFQVFEVGLHAANSLIYAEQLASLGNDLSGRKIVLSLSPGFFLIHQLDAPSYEFNFSRLHGYDIAFSTDLSLPLRKQLARRMLTYPDTLGKDGLLNFALERLAAGQNLDLAQYWLVYPLGRLQAEVLYLQDHWESIKYIYEHPKLTFPTAKARTINWKLTADRATQAMVDVAKTNEFGIADPDWIPNSEKWLLLKDTLSDEEFLRRLDDSLEWTDLEITLRMLKQMGAEVLVLSQPIKGTFYDYMGVSADTRNAYYDRLEKLGAKYGYPVMDFRKFDGDLWFDQDWVGHISTKGWVYFNIAMDDFYHDRGN